MRRFDGACPVCGNKTFSMLWAIPKELVGEWRLSEEESAYISRQQGFTCCSCRNNLRAMALAAAVLSEFGFCGTLDQFCDASRRLDVLEINEAANLAPFLGKMHGHRLIEYPQIDMLNITFAAESFDLIIHSDTLEHVADPLKGLAECYRVLRSGGRCVFTVPTILGRMTRSRAGLPNSYHGDPEEKAENQRVHTEFGADVWKMALEAGFLSCKIFCFEYPAGLALIAQKTLAD
ncbi:MAG: methyltransferase domain-containing protein [Burkholderiales bacterium]|nr:methyltransferase domain-containing protein [Burkholderiales bacterium]